MKLKNILITLLAMAFVLAVWSIPLNKISRFGADYLNNPPAEMVLDADIINDFMAVWSEFAQKDISRTMKQVSLNSNGKVPARVVRWLAARGWSPEYFFAVEQHLRELVSIANLKNNLEDSRQLYEKGSDSNLRKVVDGLDKQFKAAQYNQQELELVRANIYQITNVLDGKAVMKK